MIKGSKAKALEVTVFRGSENNRMKESVHAVDAVVCDGEGRVIASFGDAERSVFPRSSIKLLQAIALVESGAADRLGLEDRHLALACASHNAESFHVAAAGEMLQRAGLEPRCLECGAQLPHHPHDVAMVIGEGGAAAIHNNCSGKHAGFLCYAAGEGIATQGYVKFGHQVQRDVAAILEQTTGAPHGEENHAIDGCSIPTYLIPLTALAGAYGKVAAGEGFGKSRDEAATRLRNACMTHPDMVAGTGRFCTGLMQEMNSRSGKVFVKTGAEGVFTAALPELGIGFSLKCQDGTTRAAEVACATLIESLLEEADSELSDQEANCLKKFANPVLRNWNGIEVGSIHAGIPDPY